MKKNVSTEKKPFTMICTNQPCVSATPSNGLAAIWASLKILFSYLNLIETLLILDMYFDSNTVSSHEFMLADVIRKQFPENYSILVLFDFLFIIKRAVVCQLAHRM